MDILIAALHAAADYRFWIGALLMAVVIALVLLPPRRGWQVSLALLALLVLANRFFGDRHAGALQARLCETGAATSVAVVDRNDRNDSRGDGNSARATSGRRGSTRSVRQVETAR